MTIVEQSACQWNCAEWTVKALDPKLGIQVLLDCAGRPVTYIQSSATN